jgi:hypothetical protein
VSQLCLSVSVIGMPDGTISVNVRSWDVLDPKAGTFWEVRRRVVAPPSGTVDGAAVARLLAWVGTEVDTQLGSG